MAIEINACIQPKSDFFKPGEIVRWVGDSQHSRHGYLTIVCKHTPGAYHFSGVDLSTGEYDSGFIFDQFVKVVGEIKLRNEV